MDPFSPLVPAHVRVLVLPVGDYERADFSDVLLLLQKEVSVIKLNDVSPYLDERKLLLSPKAFPNGSLLYNYSAAIPTEQQEQMSPFEHFRPPMLVLGVLRCSESSASEKELVSATEYMRERHPRVIHRHLMVLTEGGAMSDKASPAVAYVNVAGVAGPDSLHKAICQVSADFLAELSTYTAAMQATPNVQTPGHMKKRLPNISTVHENDGRPATSQGLPPVNHSPSTPTDEVPKLPQHSPGSRPPTPVLLEQMMNSASNARASTGSDGQTSASTSKHGRTSSQDRIPLQGFGSATSQEKMRHRGKSRVGIVIGSLHMMAGQWPEALRILVEHTTKARTLGDHIWHGKGLDNIVTCLLLHVSAGVDFQIPSVCFQLAEKTSAPQQRFSVAVPSEFRPSDFAQFNSTTRLASHIPELLIHILSLYNSGEGMFELSTTALIEASLRFSKLLAFLHLSGGKLNTNTFELLLSTRVDSSAEVEAISSHPVRIGPNKSHVDEILSQIIAVPGDDLDLGDAISVLAGVASIYGLLQMKRKKGIAMRALVLRLTDGLTQARKRGAAEMGIHPTASQFADVSASVILDGVGERSGTHQMVYEIARSYSIPLPDLGKSGLDPIKHVFGNDDLKVHMAKELMEFCEASTDPLGAARIALSLFHLSSSNGAVDVEYGVPPGKTSADEQSNLAGALGRLIGAARHFGLSDIQVPFWDPFLVRRVEFTAEDSSRTIIDRRRVRIGDEGKSGTDASNPLLYDRNSSRPGTAIEIPAVLLVCSESVECLVTLQNPNDVSVEIERLTVVCEGVELKTTHDSIILGPQRLQSVSLVVTPLAVGDSKILGCRIKVKSCAEHIFPIVEEAWVPYSPKLITETDGSVDVQRPGRDPPSSKCQIVSATVIPAQPVFELQANSLSESSMVLVAGEEKTFTVEVKNTSGLAAHIFDLVSAEAAVSLSSVTHGDNEVVLKESDGASQFPITLDPGKSTAFGFTVLGESGLSRNLVNIYYSLNSPTARFARTLTVPMNFTVHTAVLLRNVSVTSIIPPDSDSMQEEVLVAIELESSWTDSVSCRCSIGRTISSGDSSAANETVIAPGEIKRVLLSTSARELDLASDPRTNAITTSFAKRLGISWKTKERKGKLDVSKVVLSPASLAALMGSPAQIGIKLIGDGKNSVPKAGSFTAVRVRVDLEHARIQPSPLFILLQARAAHGTSAFSDDDRIVISGGSQRFINPALEAREVQAIFPVCFLLSGEVELVAYVRAAQISSKLPVSPWQASRMLRVGIV